jgi:hypothetical protein
MFGWEGREGIVEGVVGKWEWEQVLALEVDRKPKRRDVKPFLSWYQY